MAARIPQPTSLDAAFAVDEGTDTDATTERILDAALAEFLDFGLRRATVEDITRRAGVGRMTVHRRFPSKQSLTEAVWLREIRRVLDEVRTVIARHRTLEDKLTEGMAFGLRGLSENPLFTRLLDTDREAMQASLTVDGGALVAASTEFVREQIRADGTGPKGRSADYAAEAILRICHSILLTPRGRYDFTDGRALRAFLRSAITPLVAPGES
jgi:TetR/AcrR family transcriptional regulator, repressor for uid operon